MLLSICLVFCQFQPGVAYNVAYKKRVYCRNSDAGNIVRCKWQTNSVDNAASTYFFSSCFNYWRTASANRSISVSALWSAHKMKRHKMNKLIYISKGRLVNLHDPLKQKSYFTAHCFNHKFLETITFAGTPIASDIM